MKNLLIAGCLLLCSTVFANDYLTVLVSSQLTSPQLDTIRTYGNQASKHAVLATQVFQGPNTSYYCIVIETTTASQDAFFVDLINSGKLHSAAAYIVQDNGLVTQHYINYPDDYFTVWQSSN